MIMKLAVCSTGQTMYGDSDLYVLEHLCYHLIVIQVPVENSATVLRRSPCFQTIRIDLFGCLRASSVSEGHTGKVAACPSLVAKPAQAHIVDPYLGT